MRVTAAQISLRQHLLTEQVVASPTTGIITLLRVCTADGKSNLCKKAGKITQVSHLVSLARIHAV